MGPGGRRRNYGSLVEAAAQMPVPTAPKLKDPKDFKILGKPTKWLDTPPVKVNGRGKFGIDAQVPGMLVAVMARAPAKVPSRSRWTSPRPKAVKGVQQVITLPTGVARAGHRLLGGEEGPRRAGRRDWDLGRNREAEHRRRDGHAGRRRARKPTRWRATRATLKDAAAT